MNGEIMLDKLQNFFYLVKDVWQQGFLGISFGQIIIAILILAISVLIRGLFSRFILVSLRRLASRTKAKIDDKIIDALDQPIRFIPIILGVYFATEYLTLSSEIATVTKNLVRALIVFQIFWMLVNIIDPISIYIRKLETVFSPSMVDWLIKAIRITLIFIGAATILEIWGIKIGPILAGLGLFGVAVALGAQDLFKNLISGISIIAEKRFNPGEWIRVEGEVEGIVESIGFRSTLIRRFDKAPVYVPNTKLSDNSVINFSQMTFRRISWVIGVEYRTTIDQLRMIRDGIEKNILESKAFAHPPEVPTFVRIDKFSDSSIDIMVYCFTKTKVWGEWLELKEKLAYHIKKTVEGAGSAFAFPSQSVYLESVPGESPEVFIPPKSKQIIQNKK
jgi:MscS family membrane protein